MKFTIAVCFLLFSALYGAHAAPAPAMEPEASEEPVMPEEETACNTTSTPTTQTQEDLTASGFNCSALGEGAEHMLAVSSLLRGLFSLLKYSDSIHDGLSGTNIDNEANECPSISYEYDFGTNIWSSIAVLEGYSTLAGLAVANSTLDEQIASDLTGAQDVISAVLKDYRAVLSQKHCECSSAETCYSGTVTLNPPLVLKSECKPYPYLADHLKDEVVTALIAVYAENFAVAETGVSESQWVESHLSTDSPAYQYFQ